MFEWLPERIASLQGTTASRERGWQFLLRPPATEEGIRACELALGRSLPPSYRAFLLRWDGVSLFRSERRRPDGRVELSSDFGVAGTQRLPELNRRLRAELPPDVLPGEWGQLIVCCETPSGTADHAALNPEHQTADGEYAVVDCFHESRPRCWQRAVVAPSFEVWLRRALDAALQSGNPYYWLDTPELLALYRECQEEDQREAAERLRRRQHGPEAPPSPTTG